MDRSRHQKHATWYEAASDAIVGYYDSSIFGSGARICMSNVIPYLSYFIDFGRKLHQGGYAMLAGREHQPRVFLY